jgi:sigma-B regulation protein RsbU (phosphoserine phosphatase)
MAIFRRGHTDRDEGRTDPRLSETVAFSTEHLKILNRVLQATRGPYEVPELLELLVREIVDALGARWGTIKMRGEGEEDVARTMIRRPGLHAGTVPRAIENTAFLLVYGSREPLVVDDLTTDARFPKPEKADEGARCLVAVPIQHKGEMTGVLTLVDRREGGIFLKYHQELAMLLATEAGALLANARLLEEVLQRRAFEKERELAETVWRRFLPSILPEVTGFALAATCNPARRIGGDYYDFICQGDGRTVIALGDVSGSGMPAALLMSNLQAMLRMSLRMHPEPERAVTLVNEHLCSTTDPQNFATLFLGVIDPATRVLTYVNAGHNPPYVLGRDGKVAELRASGIPIGFLPDAVYEAPMMSIPKGSRLLMFSDGIVEATRADGEMFGEERLLALARESEGRPPGEQVQAVMEAVESWCAGSTAYQDDRTLVILDCCAEG